MYIYIYNTIHYFAYLTIQSQATQIMMSTSNCFSFAGPDGIKVGQDLSVEMAVVTTGKSKEVAVAAAQVLLFDVQLKYPIGDNQSIIANMQ